MAPKKGFSMGKKKGCIYYQIFYPGFLTLNDRFHCYFKFKSEMRSILIREKIKAVSASDLSNNVKFIEQDGKKNAILYSPIELPENSLRIEYNDTNYIIIDTDKHHYKIFRPEYFTDMIISFESNGNEDSRVVGEILNEFINSYRYSTNNFWIQKPSDIFGYGLVYKEHYHQYSKEELSITDQKQRLFQKREINFVIKQVGFPSALYNDNFTAEDINQHSESLQNFLSTNPKRTFQKETYLKAQQDLIVYKNFKYSFLQCFFVIETITSEFLDKKKSESGISNKKLKELKSEVGISYMLNIEIPLVVNGLSPKQKELIGKVGSLRKKRNDIVHNSADVSEEEAQNALVITQEYLNFIHSLMYTSKS